MGYTVLLGCKYSCGFAAIFILKKDKNIFIFLSFSSFKEIYAATTEVKTSS